MIRLISGPTAADFQGIRERLDANLQEVADAGLVLLALPVAEVRVPRLASGDRRHRIVGADFRGRISGK